MAQLIASLKRDGILRSKPVEEALAQVRRENFLWPGTPPSAAYVDEPLLLGETGQTISAPSMVVMMLEELELLPGMRVLEIGAGSGYNAALIAHIVKPESGGSQQSSVISVERDSELARFAKGNLERARLDDRVSVVVGDGTLGYPPKSERATYDRIVVTAGAPRIPQYFELQLKPGGILIVPVGNLSVQTLLKLRKVPGAGNAYKMSSEEVIGCMFVPLVGEEGYDF